MFADRRPANNLQPLRPDGRQRQKVKSLTQLWLRRHPEASEPGGGDRGAPPLWKVKQPATPSPYFHDILCDRQHYSVTRFYSTRPSTMLFCIQVASPWTLLAAGASIMRSPDLQLHMRTWDKKRANRIARKCDCERNNTQLIP